MSDKEKCKKKVWNGWHSSHCSRNAVLDGYCRQHHPEAVKAREEASARMYEERWKNSPEARLAKCMAALNEIAAGYLDGEEFVDFAERCIALAKTAINRELADRRGEKAVGATQEAGNE